MSTTRTNFEGRLLEIYEDGSKTFEFTIINSETGEAQDMSDDIIFNSGTVTILKPSGDTIGDTSISFTDRDNGVVDFIIEPPISDTENVGNWIGHLAILNEDSQIIEQQNFNFNILSKRAK